MIYIASAARAVTQTVRFPVDASDERAAERIAEQMLERGAVVWPEPPEGFTAETDGWFEGIEEEEKSA